MSTDNIEFRTRSRPYQREAFGLSGPGLRVGTKNFFCFCKEKVRYYSLTLGAMKDIGCTLGKNSTEGKKAPPAFMIMTGANLMPNS